MQHDSQEHPLYSTDLSQNSPDRLRLRGLSGEADRRRHPYAACAENAVGRRGLRASRSMSRTTKSRHDMLDLRVERAHKLDEKQDGVLVSAERGRPEGARSDQVRDGLRILSGRANPQRRAKTHNCDLIVMGSHERGMSHTFLGSVAKSVLRRSHVPTLIVPLGETRID